MVGGSIGVDLASRAEIFCLHLLSSFVISPLNCWSIFPLASSAPMRKALSLLSSFVSLFMLFFVTVSVRHDKSCLSRLTESCRVLSDVDILCCPSHSMVISLSCSLFIDWARFFNEAVVVVVVVGR